MQNKELLTVTKTFGTPVYVYDKQMINEQYHKLSNAFSGFKHQIHYAMKANENPEILKIFLNEGAKIDTVSPNEIRRALSVGFKPQDIIFTPSFPSSKDIDFAFEQNVHLHIGELECLQYIIDNHKDKVVGLRINPANSIEGNQKIATAHQNSKFGIPVSKLDKIFDFMKQGLKVDALHIHTGSDVKNWKDLTKSVDVLFNLVKDFPDVKFLDFGSGFKVQYKENDAEIDLTAYANHIKNKLKSCQRDLIIQFEPGKFLVSKAGYLLVRVNAVKQGYQKQFAGVNSGFHHLIRPMYYDAYHEIINLSNPNGKLQKYDVVGQLCEEDTFAYDRLLPEVKKGDILAIKNAGAYGFSMVSNYNLRDKPKEILWDKNKAKDISL